MEAYYYLNSGKREKGDDYSYSFKQMRLPTHFQPGDTIKIEVQDQLFARVNAGTNHLFSVQLGIEGTNLYETNSNEENGKFVSLFFHRYNSTEEVFLYNQRNSYTCKVLDSFITFHIRNYSLDLDTPLTAVNYGEAEWGNQYLLLKITKMNVTD